MDDDSGVISLGEDGLVSKWTRSVSRVSIIGDFWTHFALGTKCLGVGQGSRRRERAAFGGRSNMYGVCTRSYSCVIPKDRGQSLDVVKRCVMIVIQYSNLPSCVYG